MSMSTDLSMLVLLGLLSVLQAFPYTLALIANVGLIRAMSYPQPSHDGMADWVQRSKRAHLNMVENIAPFAILVIVANLTQTANETTATWSMVFVACRVLMILAHTFAIAFLRTLSWFTSLGALVVILLQIV